MEATAVSCPSAFLLPPARCQENKGEKKEKVRALDPSPPDCLLGD